MLRIVVPKGAVAHLTSSGSEVDYETVTIGDDPKSIKRTKFDVWRSDGLRSGVVYNYTYVGYGDNGGTMPCYLVTRDDGSYTGDAEYIDCGLDYEDDDERTTAEMIDGIRDYAKRQEEYRNGTY